MANYRITSDSTTDLPAELISKLDIDLILLKYTLDTIEYTNYPDARQMSFPLFYEEMRNGAVCTTTQYNPDDCMNFFENILSKGQDILHIAFSSQLSGSYNSALIARDELSQKYPDRKIIIVDSRAASLGEGLFVYLAAQKRDEGYTIEELEKWLYDTRDHICHWFTVNDLFFLKRGGRVSAASAVIGSALGIKPILHVDNEGRLIPVKKIRGRRNSLDELACAMKRTCVSPENQTIFISHGDCLDDAKYLAEKIKSELHVKDVIINYIGPVIGSHSGPGTMALFFVGSVK